jgi:two-component system, sensor histidine kinase
MRSQLDELQVLIVDDHVDSADALALLIETWGSGVQLARNGLDALKVADTFAPSVALIDLEMPGMDGYELARRLQAFAHWKTVSMIAISGHGTDEHRQRALESGFEGHLVKPVPPDVLKRTLQEIASRRPRES